MRIEHPLAVPIVFNADLAIAVHHDNKSCTRRLIKPQPDVDGIYEQLDDGKFQFIEKETPFCLNPPIKPPYKTGTIIYLEEAWAILRADSLTNTMTIHYRIDDGVKTIELSPERFDKFSKFIGKNGWQSPYFMPREAARTYRVVTDVHPERLQAMSDDLDLLPSIIKAEGVSEPCCDCASSIECLKQMQEDKCALYTAYKKVWDKTVKAEDLNLYGWNANPFVWAISFKKLPATR